MDVTSRCDELCRHGRMHILRHTVEGRGPLRVLRAHQALRAVLTQQRAKLGCVESRRALVAAVAARCSAGCSCRGCSLLQGLQGMFVAAGAVGCCSSSLQRWLLL
jgi:hypothetical protein